MGDGSPFCMHTSLVLPFVGAPGGHPGMKFNSMCKTGGIIGMQISKSA